MHTEMWEHPSVVDNIALLRSRGVIIVEPQSGRLAGGDIGTGRLADPETILHAINEVLSVNKDLSGQHVVITAGGTREPIDAVRVIANRSSGKQGYALAEDAYRRGARVTVISTVDLPVVSGVSVVSVETAQQMQDAVTAEAGSADVVIMAAAVADFRPVLSVEGKIKKHQGVPTITLEPTPDILAQLGSLKPAHQILVGFAAETENLVDNARGKLERKNLDLIVANDVSAPGVGFAHDTNAVTILSASGEMKSVALANKRTIATAVLDSVVKVQSARRLPS
jgi:phosphopantothenoylcysteine decarboxylase/phosphopantothenate--cysteine ligase